MKISKITVGELQTNCYLLEKESESLLIDPGDESSKIKDFIKDKNLIGILITHKHFDHIGALEDIATYYNIPIYDNSNLKEGANHISTFTLEVIKTYGHTMDSLSYYFKDDKVMFTGDFLFEGTIGRCDFEESDYREMLSSIRKMKEYDNDIIIYPGHGPKTTLGLEKASNIYFM